MKRLTLILFVALLISCSVEKQPRFSRYITDDPYFNFPSTIESASIYDVTDTADVLISIIKAESGNKLRHELVGQETESYDMEYYTQDGTLEKRESYRRGKLVLTNIYPPTDLGVPVLDYQINEGGNEERTWIPKVDLTRRVIERIQNEQNPFFASQDVSYWYNEKKQLTRVEHKFRTRPGFVEFYFYDSLGNVIRGYEDREGKQTSPSTTTYEFDQFGNWVKSKTTMDWSKGYGYKRRIKYFSSSK